MSPHKVKVSKRVAAVSIPSTSEIMGNLLGTPITEKETHVGITLVDYDGGGGGIAAAADNGTNDDDEGRGLPYGLSSMQGWRVHMEDAHIAQPYLYAERRRHCHSPEKEKGDTNVDATSSANRDTNNNNNKPCSHERIALPNHSLFAVFDGHGGKFAAEYAARNLLRVLCRSDTFVQYAVQFTEREGYLLSVKQRLQQQQEEKKDESLVTDNNDDAIVSTKEAMMVITTQGVAAAAAAAATATTINEIDEENNNNSTVIPQEKLDRLRLFQQLKKRGHESDEKVRAIKAQVRRHLGDDENDDVNGAVATPNPNPSNNDIDNNDDADADAEMESNSEYQYARATYDRELLTLLEKSLRDAFIDVDAEILGEVRGDSRVQDANIPYGNHENVNNHTNNDSNNSNSNSNNKHIDHPIPSVEEDAGTTAVAVLITPKLIVCANAGDSRAVYSRSSNRVRPLSYDHKPTDDDEERRIRAAGGYVSAGRVEGDLAVSRGLGDFRFKEPDVVSTGSMGENSTAAAVVATTAAGSNVNRLMTTARKQLQQQLEQEEEEEEEGGTTTETSSSTTPTMTIQRPSEQKVSPVPDVIVQTRNHDEDEFIIIACDGIWDVNTNQEAVQMVSDIFADGESNLGLVCEEILDLCLLKGSKDNMTALVVKFPKQTIGDTNGGGVLARRERRRCCAGRMGSSSLLTRNDDDNDDDNNSNNNEPHAYVPPHRRRQLDDDDLQEDDNEE